MGKLTLTLLLLQAEIYEHEGNEQQTYLLLLRHAELVLKNLAHHPDVRSATHRAALANAKRDVQRSFAKMEVLKPQINRVFEQHQKHVTARTKNLLGSRSATADGRSGETGRPSKQRQQSPVELPATEPEPLTAGENRDFAVRLAHSEIKRRALARKATRQAGISEEVEHQRRTAGLWGHWEEALSNDDPDADRDALSLQMQSVRVQAERRAYPASQNGDDETFLGGQRPTAATYHYPSVPARTAAEDGEQTVTPEIPAKSPARRRASPINQPSAPTRPPKEALTSLSQQDGGVRPATPPPRPSKQVLAEADSSSVLHPTSATSAAAPLPPRTATVVATTHTDTNPAAFTISPSAHLENGTPLRTIFLPPDLRHRFLTLAASNTRQNIETCGILCGTLIANALFISRLVLPEQTGTSDTCETVNENRLFDYVDGEDLMMLGWIHTHPTQTCFMSSRDLHTHAGYQVMLPESIAIVCAPSKNEYEAVRTPFCGSFAESY